MSQIARRSFLFSAVLLPTASDPDFSGNWKLNLERSDTRSLPGRPCELLKIEGRGTTIRCSGCGESWTYSADGKETRHKLTDRSISSILKWEGAALLVNTIVNGRSQSYTEMDRWKLSRDGRTLTIRREIVRLRGITESVLVYEKLL
jgi:hypothetical protein